MKMPVNPFKRTLSEDGANLRTLHVTKASQPRAADEPARLPQSGGIVAMRVDVPGLPELAIAG